MKVTGKITDTVGNPIPDINIVEFKTTIRGFNFPIKNGTVTDINGKFTIVVDSAISLLEFSHVSFNRTFKILASTVPKVLKVKLENTLPTINIDASKKKQ